MTELLQNINPITSPGWDDLVTSAKNYSFFHSSYWAEVIEKSYNYRPVYFKMDSERNHPVLLPLFEVNSLLTGKRGVSLPFSDYCHPLYHEEADLTGFMDSLVKIGEQSNWKYIEFRGNADFLKRQRVNRSYYTHTLEIDADEDSIYQRFRSSTKRNIRKAIREGVTVEAHSSLESLKEFCRLNCLTRKKHGLPPQPYKFFKNILNHVIMRGKGIILLAYYQNHIIGGAIFFGFGSKALYKFGASDWRYQNLRGNNLIMWEGIRYYARRGYKQFCFGRTEPENHGLRQFKTGWGTNEQSINYYKYDLTTQAFISNSKSISESFSNSFHKMPIPLLKFIGSIAYKHIG